MTSRDFCYWLQGLLELGEVTELNSKQVEILKNHLAMVFVHEIDPSFGDQKKQDKLNSLHTPSRPNVLMKC
jgi:hypothetical protein